MNIIIVNKNIETANIYQKIINTEIPENCVMCFDDVYAAYDYLVKNTVNIAIIDAELQSIIKCSDGISLAQKIKKEFPQIMIVLCHYDGSYIRHHNQIGIDYYLITPISDKILISTVEKMSRFCALEEPQITVTIKKNMLSIARDKTVAEFRGKMKIIMETIIQSAGKSVTNQEIFSIAWPGRPYDNVEMKVYHNALHRIRTVLAENKMDDLLASARCSLSWNNNNTKIYCETESCESI